MSQERIAIKDKTVIKNLGLGSCGLGAEMSQVDVKDGKIVRVRPLPFDRNYPIEYLNPWKMEVRGSTFEPWEKTDITPFAFVYKKRVYSPNRILYPLKREDWDPRGDRNPQNRGISKFVRISWDEATTLIADEIKRIHDEYGPASILCEGDGHGETKVIHATHSANMNLLSRMGGFTMQCRNADSWEGWYWGAKHVWGCDPVGQADMGNTLLDVAENSKMLLFWGCDMETTTWGWGGHLPSRYCNWLTEIGIKQVYICPDVNYGCAVHADKWIPVYPNTDVCLQLGIIHTWLKEDLWDKEYVASHVIGMEYIEQYVLGSEDGIAKSPEWAEPLCGVPARTIKALARKWHKDATSIAHCNGGSYIRSCYSSEPARYEAILLGMQGLGAPGRNFMKFIEWNLFGRPQTSACPMPSLQPNFSAAYRGFNWNKSQTWDFRTSFIPKTLIPEAILGDYTQENPLRWYATTSNGWPREDQFNRYRYPTKFATNPIHMIWTDCPCWSTCWNGGNEFIKALRSEKIETIVAQHVWLENDCLFADVILPTNTHLENNDMSVDLHNGNYVLACLERSAIDPIGDTKSDWEAVAEVSKKLDMYENFSEGKTEEDMIRAGFDGSGLSSVITYEDFCEREYYASPTAANWKDFPRGFYPFYADPVGNPLKTPSGKLEFYSESLAINFPDDNERPPYPKYIPYGESHQESRVCKRAEKYPYLLVSNHPHWRVHANLDDVPWLREFELCKIVGPDGYQYEPIWVNPKDADALGLKHGDIARICNERGWVMGGVYVTERILEGVILQDHGARVDPIENGVSDRGGANNLIAPSKTVSKNCAGEVTSGYLVGIEKVDVFELAKQYPEAFRRAYDPGIGVNMTSWIKESE